MLGTLLFISGQEIVFALLIVLLLFGSKEIPKLARTFGRGMKEFKRAWLAAALLATPLLLGMGGGGGQVSDSIPRPEKNHTGTMRDHKGVVTEVTHLACNGKTYLPLRRGEGTLMVPFSLVRKVEFTGEGPEGVAVVVQSTEGDVLEGTVSYSIDCTGATSLGNYRIPVTGVAEITLH